VETKRTFTNFFTAHHNLGSSRTTSSRLGGITSNSNKCHEYCFTKLKYLSVQSLIKRISLNTNLNFSQITQTSERSVGESSQRLKNKYVSWVIPAPSKGGRVKLLYSQRLKNKYVSWVIPAPSKGGRVKLLYLPPKN
jgi:hypothetical protein